MDREEAKLVLEGFTLQGESREPGFVQEAKNRLDADPELRLWWEEARQGDELVKDKVLEFAPPRELRAAIRASVRSSVAWRGYRRRAVQFLGLAASVALVGVFLRFTVFDRSDDYTGPLVDRAFQYAYDGPTLSYFNRDVQKIADWIEKQDFELPDQLPPKLFEQEGIGCRPLKWSESRVVLMCFRADTTYHLFVAREEEFDDFSASDSFEFESRQDGWSVSKWSSNGYALVLTAQTEESRLASMLASYTP